MTATSSYPARAQPTSAAAGQLPTFLIVGAAKAGTTSLHRYLHFHPDIFMSEQKELKLFNRADWRAQLDWYRSQFRTDLPVRGESSPHYSLHPWIPSVPEKISSVIPNARIIYLVRDPIVRLVAQYVEFVAHGIERRSLAQALADYSSLENPFVMASRYAYQLNRYREHFPDSRILVIDQRKLLDDRQTVLREVFGFLEVDPDFYRPEFEQQHNERKSRALNRTGRWLHSHGALQQAREHTRVLPINLREQLKKLVTAPMASAPTLDGDLRARIEDHLAEDVAELRRFTGKQFSHWTI